MISYSRKSKGLALVLALAMLLALWPGAALAAEPTITGAGMEETGIDGEEIFYFSLLEDGIASSTVIDIAMKTQPTDLEYTSGQSLDLSGLVVTLTYDDESTLEVGYEDFSYMDISTNPAHGTVLLVADHHNQPVEVSCNGQTAYTDNLTVTEPADLQVTGITVKTQPTDLTYTAGQSLDLSGLVVTLTYDDESTLEVGYEDFSYMDITANPAQGTVLSVVGHHNQPVEVSCNGQTAFTDNLTVTASTGRQVTGITVKTQPADLTYTAGQSLDLSGLVVTLTYNDESTLEVGYEDFSYMDITANPAQGTALSVAGHHNQPVEISCNGRTAYTNNLAVTASGGGGGRGNDGGSSGTNNTSAGYVPNPSIATGGDQVTVDLAPNATRVSPTQTNNLIKANQESAVVIQGDQYTITFAQGTMQAVPGQTEYDFGLQMNAGPNYGAIADLAEGSLTLVVSYNHSGPLPAEAAITFNVGTSYEGQTLYYYYYNEANGQLEYVQSAVVGTDGTVTIRQSRCSDYVFTEGRLTGENVIGQSTRIFGEDRYQTAIKISKAYFGKGADTVVLTRGDSSVDALPAVPLAKQYNAPLLLTPPGNLPEEVLNEIKELGAKKVIIIGGPGAVKPEVENTLKADGLEVERIYGRTHYDTAYVIAGKLEGKTGQAVLVNGDKYRTTFPDTLSISSWAGYHGVPILYADSTADRLPEETAKALAELKVTRTILVGGPAVVPNRLESLVPDPQRYGGADCYATNAEVLQALQPNPEKVYAATGKDFADALAGAAVAAQTNAWLILTGEAGKGQNPRGLTAEQEQLLKSAKGNVREVSVFGGPAVVSETTWEAVRTLLELD